MHSAAILAGGRASRFGGQDKSALVVDGRTILERQIAELSRITTDILVVGGAGVRDRAAEPTGPRHIADLVPGCGPLGGVHAALTEARGDAVFVVACDMPYVDAPFVAYLLELTRDADAVVPRYDVRGQGLTPGAGDKSSCHPLCAAYTRACLEPIARRLADRRLKMTDLLADVRTRFVTAEEIERFGDGRRLLANVNTPAEYAGFQGHKL
jgi:molybdopterin-guanine dinucleotide biosynthesis protein A